MNTNTKNEHNELNPFWAINRQEAKIIFGMTNKEINKAEKSESGFLKTLYGINYCLIKKLKFNINRNEQTRKRKN